jgi:hypothetical protein
MKAVARAGQRPTARKGVAMIHRLTLAGALSATVALVATGCSTGATDPATSVTTSAATLNATINPDGDNYRYRFEWRPASATTMNPTPWRSVSNPGTATRRVSEQITGLAANTRYAFRFCGEETTGTRPAGTPDRAGYTCGAIREFTTAATASTGYPDASNTGVPPGTVLTPSGGITVNTPGAVIDGRDISGPVVVNAPDVRIRRSRIRTTAFWAIDNNSTGLVIEDSEIDGLGANGTCIGSDNLTVRRADIRGCENGFNVCCNGKVTVEDSYIHDLTTANGAHTDGAQVGQGASDIVFRHNTIIPQSSGPARSTSCIIMWNGDDPQNTRVQIVNNRLIGTGTAYALYTPRRPASQNLYQQQSVHTGNFRCHRQPPDWRDRH